MGKRNEEHFPKCENNKKMNVRKKMDTIFSIVILSEAEIASLFNLSIT